jgi:ABC-type lipoprotein export system ATPase subunit
MPKQVLVEVSNVEKNFSSQSESVTALKKTSFDIDTNTFTIIYGPSGSGKSTLLNILSGLQHPTHGTVKVQGTDIYKLKPDELAKFRANEIGIVYQNSYWVKSLSVIENLSLPLYFLGYNKKNSKKMALEALEKVDMGRYANKSPVVLSGGEQQRIAMARALVNDPQIIIADEPTGSLDSKNGAKIMSTLQSSLTEYNRTVILVTHNIEYLPLADRLLNINDGEVNVLPSEHVQKTADMLIHEMKQRIAQLAKEKHRA